MTSKKKIMIIDNDPEMLESVSFHLAKEGYRVMTGISGPVGTMQLRRLAPDLIIMDPVPHRTSKTFPWEELRVDSGRSRIPIILLAARSADRDGNNLADDYIPKPFTPQELVLCVRSLLRRVEPLVPDELPIECGELRIDPASFRVTRAGQPIKLSSLEFRLLHFFATHPNKVFSRDRLLDAIWGTDRFIISRSIDVYIRRLRMKIEDDPKNPIFLKTIRDVGYIFELSV